MATFDVCWAPFTQDRISKAANPVKIYEYLALGKPVVSTPVADTHSFDSHVTVASDSDAMIGAIREALNQHSTAPARIAFSDANSWAHRAREYVAFARSVCAGDCGSVSAVHAAGSA